MSVSFLSLLLLVSQTPAPLSPHVPENEAIYLALADARTLPDYQRRYSRYIWIRDSDKETLQANSFVANIISQSQLIARPYPVTDGKVFLARIDLRRLVRTGEHGVFYQPDLDKLFSLWENFQFDSAFNLLITKATLKFAAGIDIEMPKQKRKAISKDWKKVDCPPWKHTDGKTYTQTWVEYDVVKEIEIKDIGEGEVIRYVSDHIDKKALAELIDLTYSQAPVTTVKYFFFRSLSTIKNEKANKLFAILYGGLYYDLAGIPVGSKKGSDEDNLLELLGVGNVEQGVTAEKIFARIGSDQRTAVFRSEVTGSPRQIEYLKTLTGRDGQGLAVFTRDIKNSSVDIDQHAVMNLLKFHRDGTEGIFEKSNGLQGYIATDGNGMSLEKVDSSIATDRTVPAPYSTDLQGAIGCIRCHKEEGGWRISRNDVRKLLGGRFDILAERSFDIRYRADPFVRLAGLYAGDLELKLLPRARDDYASAILKATGPWTKSKSQTDIVKVASTKVTQVYGQFAYTMVTAKDFLEDIGYKPKDTKESLVMIDRLLPPLERFRGEPTEEDPRIFALKSGLPINPNDYFLTYPFMARRAQIAGGKK